MKTKFKTLFLLLTLLLSINVLIGCKSEGTNVEEKEEIVYAQVEGRVVYYYNSYKGDVADTGAKVVLLKVISSQLDEDKAKKISNAINYPSIYYEGHEDEFAELGLYMVKVDSNGDYTLNNIPNGKYTLYVHTNHVDSISDIHGAYKYTKNDIEYEIPFSKEQTEYYGFDKYPSPRWVGVSKYSTKQITINGTAYNAGETNFGMCYSGIGVTNPW